MAPGRFSFNVKGGRCESCQGDGVIKVEMHFLPDVYVPCDVCHGKRYNRETLEVRYKDKNITNAGLTVEHAHGVFQAAAVVARKLQTLARRRFGLHHARSKRDHTFRRRSAARKTCRWNYPSATPAARYIFSMSQPRVCIFTISIYFWVLHRLRDHGNTIVVIEHNLDVIKTADWIIDLGPEGGDGGGK